MNTPKKPEDLELEKQEIKKLLDFVREFISKEKAEGRHFPEAIQKIELLNIQKMFGIKRLKI